MTDAMIHDFTESFRSQLSLARSCFVHQLWLPPRFQEAASETIDNLNRALEKFKDELYEARRQAGRELSAEVAAAKDIYPKRDPGIWPVESLTIGGMALEPCKVEPLSPASTVAAWDSECEQIIMDVTQTPVEASNKPDAGDEHARLQSEDQNGRVPSKPSAHSQHQTERVPSKTSAPSQTQNNREPSKKSVQSERDSSKISVQSYLEDEAEVVRSIRHSCSSFRGEEEEDDSSAKFVGRCVMNPQWMGRLAWDFMVILLVLIDAMVLPFQMAYKAGDKADDFDEGWLWITTSFFASDICLSFNTAFEAGKNDRDGIQPGKLVTSRSRIARNYVRTWFPIDFVSTIPFSRVTDVATGGSGGANSAQVIKLTKILKLVRFLRLMRMLRLAKLAVIWERIEGRLGSLILVQTLALARVLFVLIAICHWNACLWWMVGQPRVVMVHELLSVESQTAWEDSPHWTTQMRTIGSRSFRWIDIPSTDAYLFCFYWTLGVMRTMPSEVTPVNKAERIYIMFFMFFAFSAFAVTITLITQTFFKLSERKRGFNDDMAAVRTYLRSTSLTESQQMRIKTFLRHLYDQRRVHAKEATMCKMLPKVLADQLNHAKTSMYLEKFELFRGLPDEAIMLVTPLMNQVDLAQGEVLCHRGKQTDAAWVLVVGKLAMGEGLNTKIEVVDQECLLTREAVFSKHTIFACVCITALRLEKSKFFHMLDAHQAFERLLAKHRELVHSGVSLEDAKSRGSIGVRRSMSSRESGGGASAEMAVEAHYIAAIVGS